jgi:hypothetical protein
MTKQDAGGKRIAYLVFVAAALVWGILGVMDISPATYTGYITTPQNVVNQVQTGSPAETAGMRVGDRIKSIDGIAIEDTRALNRTPRTLPGDTREIGLERDGQVQTVVLSYAGQPGGQRAISWAAALLGFAFIVVPHRERALAFRSRPPPVLVRPLLRSQLSARGLPVVRRRTKRHRGRRARRDRVLDRALASRRRVPDVRASGLRPDHDLVAPLIIDESDGRAAKRDAVDTDFDRMCVQRSGFDDRDSV